MTAQLVDAATDTHVWARTYDADASDLLRVQGEMARAIAREVGIQLTPTEVRRLTVRSAVNPVAHDEVLRGDAFRWRNGESDAQQAVVHYSRAIALQQDYGMAHAGLALALVMLNGSENIEPIRAAATRAIELDADLAEAHAAMAAVHYRTWNWEAGYDESRRALEISPGSLDGCYCYILGLAVTGRSADALAVAEQAISRSPLSGGAHFAHALALYLARRYEEAIAIARRAIEIDARYTPSYLLLAFAYEAVGQPDKAVAILDQSPLRHSAMMAIAYARSGRRAKALGLAQELAAASPPAESWALARVYLALGDNEQGLAWLAKSIDSRETNAHFLIDQQFDSVRTDARFRALVARLKFPASYDAFFNR